MLNKDIFANIVKNSPLISIDLIVQNRKDEILLGLRRNNPAQGFWFVPGGRIFKNESIANAFKRISKNELGIEYNLDKSEFIGVFEHFYDNSFFGESISTHYIAMGFELSVGDLKMAGDEQHEIYKWFCKTRLLSDAKVHEYTKNYFLEGKGIK